MSNKYFYFLFIIFFFCQCKKTHDALIGPPLIHKKADELKQTIVTPSLNIDLDYDKNVIFAADFQMAWNELVNFNGKPISMDEMTTLVTYLNNPVIEKRDLDQESIYAAARIADNETAQNISDDMEILFNDTPSPELLNCIVPGYLFAYSYLFCNLSFLHPFERLKTPLTFKGKKVKCFGFAGYDPKKRKQKKAAKQVKIYDNDSYGRDDLSKQEKEFVVEIETIKEKHQLILARVNPRKTLVKTIDFALDIMKETEPLGLHEDDRMIIPVFNFKVEKEYPELCGKTIISENPEVNGESFDFAIQITQFRLDDKGAYLKSESLMTVKAIHFNMIFDESFLIMMKLKESNYPYFAMWVANPELMAPWDL